jgi:hypothetical protein
VTIGTWFAFPFLHKKAIESTLGNRISEDRTDRRMAMFRLALLLGIGVSPLIGVLGVPGQAHAQHFRGGMHHSFQPRINPGFHRGFFDPRFNRGFDPRFNRGFFDPRFDDRFEDRFERLFDRRFDRFDDRFEDRFERLFDRRFEREFFDPHFIPEFGSSFFRPF